MLLRPDSRRMESNPTESIIGEHKYEGTTQGARGDIVNSDSSSFNVIIGAVIATLVLVFICLLLVILHYMYKHKGTYHTNEAKGSEFAETADTALQGDPALQDTMDESKKEYFI